MNTILFSIFISIGAAEKPVLKDIVVNPYEQREVVVSILPYELNQEFDPQLLDVSKRLLLATEQFHHVTLKWNEAQSILEVEAIPKLYFEDVEWYGDHPPHKNALQKKCIFTPEPFPLSQEREKEIKTCLTQQLKGMGFLENEVLLGTLDRNLLVEIKLLARYQIGKMSFSGNQKILTPKLLHILNTREDNFFELSKMEQETKNILNFYHQEGFYLCSVFKPIVSVSSKQKRVDIHWHIQEGNKMKIIFLGELFKKDLLKDYFEKHETYPKWFPEELSDTLRAKLKGEGFLAADVKVQRRVEDELEIITFQTEKGPAYYLDAPDWIGITHREIIERLYQKFPLLKEGMVFQEEKYQKALSKEFWLAMVLEGYLDFEIRNVDFIRDDATALIKPSISIHEGERYFIHATRFEGFTPELENGNEFYDLKKLLSVGKALQEIQADEIQSTLSQVWVGQGYLDAKIEREVVRTEEGLDIVIRAQLGPHYQVAQVFLRGIRKTKYNVIRNEVLLQKGDIFEEEKVRDSLAQILRLGVARNVDIRVFEKIPEQGIVYVLVELMEGPRFQFEIGPGYGTLDGLRGVFKGTWANVGGTARRFNLFVKANRPIFEESATPDPNQVLNPETIPFFERSMTLEYFEPRLFSFPLDGRISFSHQKKDRKRFSLLSNTFVAAVDYRLTRRWLFVTHYDLEFSNPFNIVKAANVKPSDSEQKRFTSMGETFVLDYRDDTFNPLQGWLSIINMNLYHSYLGGEVDFWQTTAKEDFFLPLLRIKQSKNLGFVLSVRAGFSNAFDQTKEVPVEKRFSVGGENSVRGYGERVINPPSLEGGESFFSFMTELHLPFFSNVDLFGFFDGGNAYGTNKDFKPLELRYGAGGGLRLNTPIGPLKMGYGFVLGRKEGETLGQFYLGVGAI